MRVVFGYIYIILTFANASLLHEAIYRGDSVDSLRSLIGTNSVNERNEAYLWTLHVAVVANNYEACELLLDSGADIEKVDYFEATALIYAVAGNQPRIVQLLCRKGADVEHAMGPERKTALHIAAQRNHAQVFETLMYHGRHVDLNVLDASRSTPFMLAAEKGHVDILNLHPSMETRVIMNDVNGQTALIRAVIAGQLNSVHRILHFPVNIRLMLNSKDLTGTAAVHYAARLGHKEIFDALLESCDVDITDGARNTVLMNAAFVTSNDLESYLDLCRRSVEIIKMLLLNNANFQTVNSAAHLALRSKNYEAHTILIKEATCRSSPNDAKIILPALHYAILKSNIQEIRSLLLKVDVNMKCHLDTTAIHLATSMSSEEIVRLLVDAVCDITVKDARGNTPLHFVQTAEVALILLKVNPKAVNIPNTLNELPLHVACEYERLNVVQVLAPATADIHAKTDRGLTALSIAAIKGNIPICLCLLQHGAGFNLPLNTATPLHWAVRRNFADLCLLFLNWGLKADAVDEKFDTVAHLAVSETGNIEMIRTLLEHIPVNVTNRAGYTLLHTAAVSRSTNRMDLARLLLEFGVPINAQTFNGKSALYLATLKSHSEVVRLLLEYGADTRLTYKGQTALHVAIATKSPECAELLVDADPYLLNISGFRNAKPVDFLINQMRHEITLGKLKEAKELAEAMSLLGTDVPETSLRKWIPHVSISFAKYLNSLQALVSFDEYIKCGVQFFINDYKLREEYDIVIAYLNHGMGTFYSFAAAHYPNLASKEAPRSVHELARIREECCQAVLAYEKKRDKAYYVKMLRSMMAESFLSKREQMFKGTYMDFLPRELIKDIIGTVDRGNVLRRIELVANALMLALTDKSRVEPYKRFLGYRMNRLSEFILPVVPRKSFSLKRTLQ